VRLAGAVLRIPLGTEAALLTMVLLATRPVDFRKGAHSLAELAAEVLGENPFSGGHRQVVVFGLTKLTGRGQCWHGV
jgi:hypothetical protein